VCVDEVVAASAIKAGAKCGRQFIHSSFVEEARSSYYCILLRKCLAVAKEAKVLERGAPSVTEKFFVTTSRESRSLPSVVWLAEAVSSVSLV